MLILSRKMFESVLILPGHDVDPSMTLGELFEAGPIRITVTTIEGSRVRFAIDAPPALKVLRTELMRSVHSDGEQ